MKIYQGESRPITLALTSKGSPVPIPAGAALTVGVKREPEDDEYAFAIGDANIARLPLVGVITFTPTVNQTSLAPGTYFIQVMMVDTSGNVSMTDLKPFKVTQGVIPWGGTGNAVMANIIASASGSD